MEGNWPPSQENIERMWHQIVAQHKQEHTPEEWQEAYEDFVRCMLSPAEPFVLVHSIEGLLDPEAAPKAPEPLAVAPSAPGSIDNAVEALETVDSSENDEEGAAGGASYAPPKNEDSSEEEEEGSEWESAPDDEATSQADDFEEDAYGVAEEESEDPSQDSSFSSTSSEMLVLVDLNEEESEDETEGETENYQGDGEQQQEQIEKNASQQDIEDLQGAVGGTAAPDAQSEKEKKENDEEGPAEGAVGGSEHDGAPGGSTGNGFSEGDLCAIFRGLPKILTPEGKTALGLPQRAPTIIKKSKNARKRSKKNKKPQF